MSISYVKIGFVISSQFQEPINNVKWRPALPCMGILCYMCSQDRQITAQNNYFITKTRIISHLSYMSKFSHPHLWIQVNGFTWNIIREKRKKCKIACWIFKHLFECHFHYFIDWSHPLYLTLKGEVPFSAWKAEWNIWYKALVTNAVHPLVTKYFHHAALPMYGTSCF